MFYFKQVVPLHFTFSFARRPKSLSNFWISKVFSNIFQFQKMELDNQISDHGDTDPEEKLDNQISDHVDTRNTKEPSLHSGTGNKQNSWSLLTFSLFVMFGIASVTPFFMFVTATSYFESKFNNSTPDIQQNYQNYFQTGAIITDVLFSFLTVPLARFIEIPRLVYFSNSVMLGMFALTAAFAQVDSSTWAREFFYLTEAIFCVMSASSSIYISSIFAISSSLDPAYIFAFLVGHSLSGIIAAVLSIITLSIPGIDFVSAGFWYFVAAAVILLFSLVIFSTFHCHLNQADHTKEYRTLSGPDSSEEEKIPIRRLIKDTLVHGYSCFFTRYITMLLFPAVLSTLKSTANPASPWASRYFLPVSLFLVFNVGDLIGRFAARAVEFPGRRLNPWYTTARVVFVVLTVMCNLQPRSNTAPVWFKHDVIPTILVLLLSVTNGQVFTLCFKYAAEIGASKVDKAAIGTIMSVHAALGRVLGSLSTYIVFLALR